MLHTNFTMCLFFMMLIKIVDTYYVFNQLQVCCTPRYQRLQQIAIIILKSEISINFGQFAKCINFHNSNFLVVYKMIKVVQKFQKEYMRELYGGGVSHRALGEGGIEGYKPKFSDKGYKQNSVIICCVIFLKKY
eukprot:TRINITY_DN4801_c0_g2_i2.p3 TRINITY_DN4801_c0_g2~~TRINITY_DN4801_c0_g2_i2.p3  ORF type:complete len:134 (-),score=3.63 TRINITY_DN4801_c0_g2_i2:177-578(-)